MHVRILQHTFLGTDLLEEDISHVDTKSTSLGVLLVPNNESVRVQRLGEHAIVFVAKERRAQG